MMWKRYRIVIEAEVKVQNYPIRDIKKDLHVTLPGGCLETKKVLVQRLDSKKKAES